MVWAVVAACYAPSATPCVPCSETFECPSGQVCDTGTTPPTCVKTLSNDVDASPASDGSVPDDIAPDDGDPEPPIDAPQAGPPNDVAANATDIAGGGTFTFNITDANDDYASTCGNGKDVFFELTLPAAEVIYLDTFGSVADTSVIIRPGRCTQFTGAATACVADSCGGTQVQGAWNLAAGDHCVIVDHPGNATGMQRLTVRRGGRSGDPLVGTSGTVMGNTCNDDNNNNASCGCEPAEDHHYFFTVCPSTSVDVNINTCNTASWDTVLQLRGPNYQGLDCEDDDAVCGLQTDVNHTVDTPGLYWAIVDGCDECGPYTMSYTLD